MGMEGPPKFESSGESLDELQNLLWQKAEELSRERDEISDEEAYLYADLKDTPEGAVDHDERMEKEKSYWEHDIRLRVIEKLEMEIQTLLEKIADGTLTEEDIRRIKVLTAPKEIQEKALKKEKKKKKKGKGKVNQAQDERGAALDKIFGNGGSANDPNRLTTGRHARRIKGNMDPADAQGEFYHRTADTHGGKVGYGKKGEKGTYVTKSGKRIRKR